MTLKQKFINDDDDVKFEIPMTLMSKFNINDLDVDI